MQPVIYDVAVSADGFICGAGEDISAFAAQGPIVEDYRARLAGYACAIMGRSTYCFGYRFGMKPGQNPYPWMRCAVFSASLKLPGRAVELVRGDTLAAVDLLRRESPGPVYLCGGGAFAGWLLRHGRIQRLRLKRAPVLLGAGVRLFGDHARPVALRLLESRAYADGGFFQDFALGDA